METSVSQVEEVSPTGISTPKPQSQEESNEPVTAPSVGIDTYIKFGPQNGEIIEDTNKVTFE